MDFAKLVSTLSDKKLDELIQLAEAEKRTRKGVGTDTWLDSAEISYDSPEYQLLTQIIKPGDLVMTKGYAVLKHGYHVGVYTCGYLHDTYDLYRMSHEHGSGYFISDFPMDGEESSLGLLGIGDGSWDSPKDVKLADLAIEGDTKYIIQCDDKKIECIYNEKEVEKYKVAFLAWCFQAMFDNDIEYEVENHHFSEFDY